MNKLMTHGRAVRAWYLLLSAAAALWLPLTLAHAEATQSPITQATIYYRNEVIVGWCVATAVLGAILAAIWHPPKDISVDVTLNSPHSKFLLGIAGGICAFFYMLHAQSRLTELHIVWVLGVSFAAPIFVQIAFPAVTAAAIRVVDYLVNKLSVFKK